MERDDGLLGESIGEMIRRLAKEVDDAIMGMGDADEADRLIRESGALPPSPDPS